MYDENDILAFKEFKNVKNEYNTVYINRITKLNEKN